MPRRPPVHVGGIIFWLQFCLVVNRAPITIYVILCAIVTAISGIIYEPLVVALIIVGFGGCFSPGEEIASVFRVRCADVSRCPQRAAGHTQVNPLVVFGGWDTSTQDNVDNNIDIGNIYLAIVVNISCCIVATAKITSITALTSAILTSPSLLTSPVVFAAEASSGMSHPNSSKVNNVIRFFVMFTIVTI